MENCGMWARAVLLCAALLSSSSRCSAQDSDTRDEVDLEERGIQDFYYQQNPNLTNEKRLLGALHEVLEKLQTKKINPWEKKFGQVPTCDIGEHCAIRKGSRIGKMCDCPQGAFCNFFLLKCPPEAKVCIGNPLMTGSLWTEWVNYSFEPVVPNHRY